MPEHSPQPLWFAPWLPVMWKVGQWMSTLLKELAVGAALGLTMGAAGAALGMLRGGSQIALIVSLTMVTIVIAANLIGVIFPFLLIRMRLDPAVASNPLITSITDAAGLLIYLSISTWILGLFQ